jgi:hypothetical protein
MAARSGRARENKSCGRVGKERVQNPAPKGRTSLAQRFSAGKSARNFKSRRDDPVFPHTIDALSITGISFLFGGREEDQNFEIFHDVIEPMLQFRLDEHD